MVMRKELYILALTSVYLPGTVIYAPIKGVVHQIQDNKSELDYGPTVILKHQLEDGPVFYTLYGHLSRECLNAIKNRANCQWWYSSGPK